MIRPVYLTAQTIREELRGILPNASVQTLDSSYNIAKAEGFVAFGEELDAELRRHGIIDWDFAYDCEDISLLGVSIARLKHFAARRKGVDVAEGIAVGLLCYNEGGQRGRGHCLLIARFVRGWKAWEPQTASFVDLTSKEKESAWFVLL